MVSFLLSVRQSVRIFLVIFYVGCIAALSLLPPQDLPKVQLFAGADKLIHFMMYFIFSMLFSWAVKTELNFGRVFVIVPVTIGWGVLMEMFQLSMHQGRSFSGYDILANSLGVFVGILLYALLTRKG